MKRKIYAGVSALVVLVILLFLSAALPGCSEEALPPLPKESEETDILLAPGLSLDQDQIIEEFGYPDHFFISIDPYSGDRIETWVYYSEGKALDFDNGQLFGEEDVEDQSEEYPPTDLKPEDFERRMLEAIRNFEPRILPHTLSLDVRASYGQMDHNAVTFEIRGELWAQPTPDPLYVRTEVDLETGQCELKDRPHG